MGKKCETCCLLCEILNRVYRPNFWSYFAFLQTTLSPYHKKMYAFGTKLDVYEIALTTCIRFLRVGKAILTSQTDEVQNNALIEPVCKVIAGLDVINRFL